MARVLAYVHVMFAWLCFFYLFCTTGCFIVFVSSQSDAWLYAMWPFSGWSKSTPEDTNMIYRFLIDALLVAIFFAQHSLMKLPAFKNPFGCSSIARSLYIAATAIVLQILMNCWWEIPEITLWRIKTEDYPLCWWLFFVAHFASWATIYGTCIMLDFPEMVGVKQAHYSFMGLADPLTYKSPEFRRLLEHGRHPDITSFCVVLFFRNAMTLDRLILAIAFTVYMFTRFRIDNVDYAYLKCQHARKFGRHRPVN